MTAIAFILVVAAAAINAHGIYLYRRVSAARDELRTLMEQGHAMQADLTRREQAVREAGAQVAWWAAQHGMTCREVRK